MSKLSYGMVALLACLHVAGCGKKKTEDEPASTVSASALIIPLDLKCGDSPCIK